MRWATGAIEGMDYAAYFVEDKPVTGCYKRRLKRTELATGVLRPLERTKHE